MKKFLLAWNRTEKFIVGVLALVATLLAFSSTVLRYCFSYSPEWMEEAVVYLAIWSVFIIASSLSEERRHVSATFLVEFLPLKVRRAVEVITGAMALVFCALISYWGYEIVHVSYITDERSITSLRYPLWIIYLSLPLGLTLVSIRYLKRLYRLLFHFVPFDLQEDHEMSRSAQALEAAKAADLYLDKGGAV